MAEPRHTLETLKAKVFNQALNVFNLAYHVDDLRELAVKEPFALWYLHFPFVAAMEQAQGWSDADRIYLDTFHGLQEALRGLFSAPILIAPDGAAADNLAFIIPGSQQASSGARPAVLGEQIEAQLQGFLRARHPRGKFPVLWGCATVCYDSDSRFERQFCRALQSARNQALSGRDASHSESADQLGRIIQSRSIKTLYQPIVRLSDDAVVGYEALSRGPAGTPYESPEFLFEISYSADLTYELDRLCQQSALKVAAGSLDGAALFINTSPLSFLSKKFSCRRFSRAVAAAGFAPEQIVIELTERSGIRDFPAFGKVMREVKEAGFRLAIDDVGTGYSSLQTLSETQPEYLKIDMSMIKGIHRSPIKQQIVRSLANLGRETGIAVIAEGVEHRSW
jgi:EAL domain-containing protein (putative c-di-GMP-specific phosphodiesterase class I)